MMALIKVLNMLSFENSTQLLLPLLTSTLERVQTKVNRSPVSQIVVHSLNQILPQQSYLTVKEKRVSTTSPQLRAKRRADLVTCQVEKSSRRCQYLQSMELPSLC
jgi:hypothetical protein